MEEKEEENNFYLHSYLRYLQAENTQNSQISIYCIIHTYTSFKLIMKKDLQTLLPSAPLYDNVIGHMQNQYTIYSYDEIYMYLEKCYLFDIRTGDVSSSLDLYLQCFHKIMNAMISQRDGKVADRPPRSGCNNYPDPPPYSSDSEPYRA